MELDFDTQALEAAADRAIERGIGARGLRAVLEEVMTPLMYEVPSDPTITRVTITAESVKEHVSPAVEHDPDRTQRPRLGGAALHAEQGGVSPKGRTEPAANYACSGPAGADRLSADAAPLRCGTAGVHSGTGRVHGLRPADFPGGPAGAGR